MITPDIEPIMRVIGIGEPVSWGVVGVDVGIVVVVDDSVVLEVVAGLDSTEYD
jgi:hypothetical protein